MQSYTIVITEVDEADAALEELEAQLSDIKLLRNTVGIVSVNPEFLHSGVYDAIAAAVPFPVVGITTYSQNANGKIGTFLLSILVLTADDCEFAYGYSDAIPKEGDATKATQECYKSIRAKLSGKVKLALLYSPYVTYLCTSDHINAISALDATVPIYGSYAASELVAMGSSTRTFCETSCFENRLVMLLISGNISPAFYIGSVADSPPMISNIGEVTDVEKNIVKTINNIKANKIFEKIGFSGGVVDDLGSITTVFIVNEKDKSGNLVPIAVRSLASLRDGVAVFGGHVPLGSYLSVAVTTKEVIVSTARDTVSRINKENKGKTALIYTCLGRVIALLDEPMLEYEIINESMAGNDVNYIVASSGGEICPTSVTEARVYNDEHDQTLVACVF